MQELRPFHETVVDVIRSATSSQLVTIGQLLKKTYIPKNHQVILDAWKERTKGMNFDDDGVTRGLEVQKERSEFTQGLLDGHQESTSPQR